MIVKFFSTYIKTVCLKTKSFVQIVHSTLFFNMCKMNILANLCLKVYLSIDVFTMIIYILNYKGLHSKLCFDYKKGAKK